MASSAATALPKDRDLLPMDCDGFNPYHNPNDIKRFNILRENLLMDELELGSGNFGSVKKGSLTMESWDSNIIKQEMVANVLFKTLTLLFFFLFLAPGAR